MERNVGIEALASLDDVENERSKFLHISILLIKLDSNFPFPLELPYNCEDLWAIAVQCTVYIRKTVPNDVCWNTWSIFQIDHNSTHQQQIAVSKAITQAKRRQINTKLTWMICMQWPRWSKRIPPSTELWWSFTGASTSTKTYYRSACNRMTNCIRWYH